MAELKGRAKTWAIEFIASLLFSLAYFILVGRTQSAEFSLNILELSALVSFIYIVAVFVSSFNFRADLFPFYSLLRCFFEKSLVPLWLNIPAQLFGTVAGLLVYLLFHGNLLTLSPFADIGSLKMFEIGNIPMRSLLLAVLVFILVYTMIIVRKLFLLKGMTGTFVIAILIFVLSAISFPVHELSVVTWWQDSVLNFYHYLVSPNRSLGIGFADLITALVIVATIFIANVKALQYVRSDKGGRKEYEEPGEYAPTFTSDYDI